MRTAIAATLCLFASSVSFALTPPKTAPISNLVNVVEVDSTTNKPRPCVSENCLVDMKSTLVITPDLSRYATPGTGALDPTLIAQRAALNSALQSLRKSLDLSQKIHGRTSFNASASDSKISRQFGDARAEMLRSIGDYIALDSRRWGISTELDSPELAPGMSGLINEPGDFGLFIAVRLREIDERERSISSDATGYFVRLAAFRERQGAANVPIHVENYDTFDAGKPSFIARHGFTVSPEEREQAERDFAATNAIAEAIRTHFRQLLDAARSQVSDLRARIDELTSSLQSVRDQLGTDFLSDIEKAATSVDQAAAETDGPVKQRLKTIAADVRKIGTDLTKISGNADAVRQTLISTRRALTTALDTGDAAHPEKVLFSLMDAASGVDASTWTSLKELRASLQSLITDLGQARNRAAALAGDSATKKRVLELCDGIVKNVSDRIRQDLDKVDVVDKTIKALLPQPAEKANLADAARFLGVDAPEVRTIAAADIVPGKLLVDYANVIEGDQIALVAEVLHRDSVTNADTVVTTDRRTVTPLWFGWHQGLSTGLTFVTARESELAKFAPEATAVFRFRYRARPEHNSVLATLRPGIGVHTMTLHFGDSNNPQFGLGISAHLFDDFLQAGYGFNVRAENDQYWYFGVGVIRALRAAVERAGAR